MTDQEVQLFLADLAIIILFARLLGMRPSGSASRRYSARSSPASC